jgi:hypothetical protein
MTKSGFVRESVIKGYLNGKSFDEISAENNIAKGSVFNIIHTWTAQINIPDIEAMREFSTILKNSGITIKQCAQSFRFIQILDRFGIKDEMDSGYIEDRRTSNSGEDEDDSAINIKKNSRRRKDHAPTSRDSFYYFIEIIYNHCKKQNIGPTNVIKWIQDLIDFSTLLYSKAGKDAIGFESDLNETDESQNLSTNKKPLIKRSEDNSNERETQIPFVSEINGYIEQKKLRALLLEDNNKKLQQKVRVLEEQKNIVASKFANLKREESISLTYLDWYESLKQDLFNTYKIKLEEEVSSFVNMFADFKYYDYDALQIVKEFKEITSLRDEKKIMQGFVDSIIKTRDDTLKEIRSLNEQENYARESLNVLIELNYAGFELGELKQLKNVVTEIAVSNGIKFYEAGKKFLTDVKNQYDDKLGFEIKINEIKTEMKKLEDQVPGYKEYLQSRPFMTGTLELLYKHDVTDEDIINMTKVVTAYLNGNIIFDPNLQSENIVDKNKSLTKSDYWRLFINEIRNLGNINSQITRNKSYLDKLNKEIDNLNSQRQKLNEQTMLSGQILNSLNNRLSYFIESLKEIFVSAKVQNKMFIVYQPLFFIHVTTDGNSNDDSIKREDK